MMGSTATKDIKDTEFTSTTADDGATDVAVGLVEEHRPYTFPTFYRSVLFQMIMFGAYATQSSKVSNDRTSY
jgi:hypothetical protein